MKKTRGVAGRAVLLAVIGATTVITIGLSSRHTELRFEDRTRCRAAARWAAESAVNRGITRAGRGLPPRVRGELDGASYRLEGRVSGGSGELDGYGRCVTNGREIAAHVNAAIERKNGRWTIVRFEERPVSPTAPPK